MINECVIADYNGLVRFNKSDATHVRSQTSPSAKDGQIAAGFLASDLANALGLPKIDNTALGASADKPEVIVAAMAR